MKKNAEAVKDATKEALVFLADKFSRDKEDTLLKMRNDYYPW